MVYRNEDLLNLITQIDLGSSVAEQDTLLETARVETSVFNDLLLDKVDLIPGTKGSGKSALFRIFVEFLPDHLLKQQKAVIAHGVNHHGDSVFHAFKDQFKKLEEDDFVDFWCIYVVSLVHEQFIKNARYAGHLRQCRREMESFRRSCEKANIPEVKAKKSLKDILAWTLNTVCQIRPKLAYELPENAGRVELDLFGEHRTLEKGLAEDGGRDLPRYMQQIKEDLEAILKKSNLSIWFMVDKLDEIFPRRSDTERKALRGLLRTMRIFTSDRIRIKVFLRDDMLDQVVRGGNGFTALTHITARQADTLRWSEDEILTMIVKRLFAHSGVQTRLRVDADKMGASLEYRREAFYKVFPRQVFKGKNQSSTLRWIYSHTADGNNVVTPRDVIDLLTRAKQHQHNVLISNSTGESSYVISPQAIQYGLSELSTYKRRTYLEAEFPHLWSHMEKFCGGKTEYTERALRKLLGKEWKAVANDLTSIGFMSEAKSEGWLFFRIPSIYRKGLDLTQGRSV